MSMSRSTPTAIAISTFLNSLASSATAAVQSTEVTTGTSANISEITANWTIVIGTITASALTRVDVYVWGTNDSSGYPGATATTEVITGTAGTITLSANGNTALRFLRSTVAHTTGLTLKTEAEIVSVLGFVPARWGLVFVNQTGAALASSGHSAEYVETSYS